MFLSIDYSFLKYATRIEVQISASLDSCGEIYEQLIREIERRRTFSAHEKNERTLRIQKERSREKGAGIIRRRRTYSRGWRR